MDSDDPNSLASEEKESEEKSPSEGVQVISGETESCEAGGDGQVSSSNSDQSAPTDDNSNLSSTEATEEASSDTLTEGKNSPAIDTKPDSTPEEFVEATSKQTIDATTPVDTTTGTSPPVAGDGGKGGGWGGWGGWGSSLWSSVSTVAESAQALGQKVTAVIATVEDSLGVPSPQEMAQEGVEVDQETRSKLAEEVKEHDMSPERGDTVTDNPHHEDSPSSDHTPTATPPPPNPEPTQHETQGDLNFGAVSGFLSGFAAAVQTTGQGLVSGGLDALETLGKKTMEVLSEGDPRLAKKRAMLGVGPSPTLSQLLKEAKAAEVVGQTEEREGLEATQVPLNYSKLFDEYHGVSHLEALELLSKECAGKVHSLCGGFSGDEMESLQEKLEKLSEAFAIDEEQENVEDDSSQLEEVRELFSGVTLPFKVDKLNKVSAGWREKVCEGEGEVAGSEGEEGADKTEGSDDKKATGEVLYENGLRSLAEITSTAIELFRKMAEVSLLPDLPKSEPLLQAQKFNRLTILVSNELEALASVYSEAITKLDLEGSNASVTSLYLESSNSGSYVQDAFQLLLPVLKVCLVQQLKLQQPEPNILNRN